MFYLFGTEKWKSKVREEFKDSPLMFGSFEMKEKEQDIYLGDALNGKGLAASVEDTINRRIGKAKGLIYEVAAIMKDHRMQAMGGMQVAWEICERSLVPALLANCGSWVRIPKSALKTLNNTQNIYCKLIYSCPDSTPLPALRGEAGLLDFQHRIMVEKICLLTKIMNEEDEEDSYAKEILKEQMEMGWEGLTKEVMEMCEEVGLPNACTVYLKREEVSEAVMYNHLKILKEEYGMEKLKHLQNMDIRYMQKYMAQVSLENSRLEFRYRVRMLDTRADMGKRYSFRYCPHCPAGRLEGLVENSQHWLECVAYKEFRKGADPENVLADRTKYLRRVQILREHLEKAIRN